MASIFDPIALGGVELSNRVVMAPMTRARANADGTPGSLAAAYYAQRATVGLIVTEGTQPSDDGQGYPSTPGIYTDAHVEGWRKVTDAVHAGGARIFFQIMHAGRMSHPDNTPHHRQAVAPSAIAPGSEIYTLAGMKEIPVPRALSTEEVRSTTADYRFDAARAIEAGADGVEIHGIAYLIHQFLSLGSNVRWALRRLAREPRALRDRGRGGSHRRDRRRSDGDPALAWLRFVGPRPRRRGPGPLSLPRHSRAARRRPQEERLLRRAGPRPDGRFEFTCFVTPDDHLAPAELFELRHHCSCVGPAIVAVPERAMAQHVAADVWTTGARVIFMDESGQDVELTR